MHAQTNIHKQEEPTRAVVFWSCCVGTNQQSWPAQDIVAQHRYVVYIWRADWEHVQITGTTSFRIEPTTVMAESSTPL